MVFSLITIAATVPLIATSTLQLQDSAQSQQNGIESELKTKKCHLSVRASARMSEARKRLLQGKSVVLRDGKVGSNTTKRDHHFSRARSRLTSFAAFCR